MDRLSLIDQPRNRQYLLEKTQHIIGGFGKGIGEPPGKISHLPWHRRKLLF
jgi:geranylgeranyl transferase type-1 subunit beta